MFGDLIDCKRILREIAILNRLRHPNIVRVHNIVEPLDMATFQELYIVMEICDSDLKKLLKADVTLTPLHIDTLLYNLLVGLQYLHSAGIYHRDLKPANVLVNQDCTAKICDFGLSRATTSSQPEHEEADEEAAEVGGGHHGPSTARRAMTAHVATRWYRAPELILLQDDYNGAIDVWSVGCIYAELCQMLGTDMQNRGPIFPGGGCFPLSPQKNSPVQRAIRNYAKFHNRSSDQVTREEVRSSSAGIDGWAAAFETDRLDPVYPTRGCQADQLELILDLLGTPSEAEIEKLHRSDAKQYLRSLPQREAKGIRERLPGTPAESLNLLEQMLRFDPGLRITVRSALEHPLFVNIRTPDAETLAPGPVLLEFEEHPVLNEAMLRHLFAAEIRRFH
jgi:mitogen-activated protein kinase 1/3